MDKNYHRNYYRNNKHKWKLKYSKKGKKWRRKLKLEVLTHYGKKGKLRCCWRNCAVSDIDMLSLDHIMNNGTDDARSGGPFYSLLRAAGFPKGFQTLCMNHQLKKEILRVRRKWND